MHVSNGNGIFPENESSGVDSPGSHQDPTLARVFGDDERKAMPGFDVDVKSLNV